MPNDTRLNIIRNVLGIVLSIFMVVWIVILFLDKTGGKIFLNIPLFSNNHASSNPTSTDINTIDETIPLLPIEEIIEKRNSTGINLSTGESAFDIPILDTHITSTPDILVPLDISDKKTSEISIHSTLTGTTSFLGKENTQRQTQEQIQQQKVTTKKQDNADILVISSIEKKIQEYEQKHSNPKNKAIKTLDISATTDNKNEQHLRKEHIKNLEQLYKEKKKNSDLKKLIQELVKNYEFNDARKYLESLSIDKNMLVHPQLYIYTYFNILDLYSVAKVDEFKRKLQTMQEYQLISDQDVNFYNGLLLIAEKKYAKANTTWKSVTDKKYTPLIHSIHTIQEKIAKKRDIPLYYQDALVGLEMLKNGYFSLAKYLATSSFEQNKKYILPYQVLAYSAFLTSDLHEAIEYFQKLTKIDPAKHNSYKYMMGISYYWLGDYPNAILHLSQLKNSPTLRTNVLRYLILGYKNIKDHKRTLEIYQELLAEKKLIDGDFVDFFTFIFVVPYEKTGKINIDEYSFELASSYIQSCKNNQHIDKNICLLGEIGLQVAKNQWTPELLDQLKKLVTVYNQNFTLQLLGDYYYYTNFHKAAKDYYLKATLMAKDLLEKEIIQKKLLLLSNDTGNDISNDEK
ncbi:MAG: hypothetical protein CR971_00455 [candidate division SR1 bacterium]|nr:MAG: hypothetical protein CR971_00455 [candidate division SR1 bacterium]